MRKKITKRSVDALKPGPKPRFLWDTELTGFGCKVTPAGRKVFILQYRTRDQGWKSAPKRVTIGKMSGDLTPEGARKIARNLLFEVKSGSDPAEAWRPGDPPTVAALASRFLTEYLPNKKRPPRQSTIDFYETLFRCHVTPKLGKKRVEAVITRDLEKLHGAMRAKPYVANRTLSLLQQAFDQAERWGWRPQQSNPALHIDRYPEERRGSRKEVMLTAEQMAALLDAIDAEEAAGTNPVACAAIRLAFWTGWRIGEVLGLEWDNLDLENGVARLLHTKTASEEYRQIPAEGVAVLGRVPKIAAASWVFPGRDPKQHLEGVRKPWSKIRARAELDQLDDLGPLRLHDLRHNIVSWDVSRGVPLEIAGKNVGHRSRRATEVYAHFAPDALKQAADERAQAMRTAVERITHSEPLSPE